jgi:hypothetical protein
MEGFLVYTIGILLSYNKITSNPLKQVKLKAKEYPN